MTVVSKKLRASAGHPDAHCNKQKTMHADRPSSLPRGRVAQQCHCGQWYSLPACHAARHRSCTADCAQRLRVVEATKRARKCRECGAVFIPRPNQARNGGGLFCSIPCSLTFTRRTPAFKEAVKRAPRRGPKPGPENPQWTGGQEATLRRRQESGKALAQMQRYRNENPHKAREWAQNRRNRKSGRLDYGTIPRLMHAQRGKCAYCHCDIRNKYHVDHITPLAKGGRHEAANVQLLCGPCNLRKSARDPIVFAQLTGRLL